MDPSTEFMAPLMRCSYRALQGGPVEESQMLERIRQLAAQGKTRKDIAAELGVTEGAVRFRMREHKIPAKGQRGPKPKEPKVPSLEPLRQALELVDGAPDAAERAAAVEVLLARVRRVVGER